MTSFRQWNNFIKTTMVATEGDLQKRRDCHVWTEAAWTARREAAALPLAKNWRWLRGGGGGVTIPLFTGP